MFLLAFSEMTFFSGVFVAVSVYLFDLNLWAVNGTLAWFNVGRSGSFRLFGFNSFFSFFSFGSFTPSNFSSSLWAFASAAYAAMPSNIFFFFWACSCRFCSSYLMSVLFSSSICSYSFSLRFCSASTSAIFSLTLRFSSALFHSSSSFSCYLSSLGIV
jgi:hypothetical protein